MELLPIRYNKLYTAWPETNNNLEVLSGQPEFDVHLHVKVSLFFIIHIEKT